MELNVFKYTLGLCILFSFLLAGFTYNESEKRNEDHVIFYPAYGYYEDGEWIIPMRVYVYEYRSTVENIVLGIVSLFRERTAVQSDLFKSRVRYFVVDSESREQVTFSFDGDPEQTPFQLEDEDGNFSRTSLNGIVEGVIRVSAEKAQEFLKNENSENGWLTIRSLSVDNENTGRVRLIEPEGLSIISDIDDTIKITEIPAGSRVVVRNTFYNEYKPAPRMAELYNNWENAAFHYVSGSPWQLFYPLSDFVYHHYPEGSFHMKSVTKQFLAGSTWRDLREVISNENVTLEQKVSQISGIFEHFPRRDFILIGDSGEKDPETFSIIREKFPDQVREIKIRDVVNARELAPGRLEGMTIIPAPTIFSRHQIEQGMN